MNLITPEFDRQFRSEMATLEEMDRTYAQNMTDEYPEIWLPPQDPRIRLWSVPRTTAELLERYVQTYQPRTSVEIGMSAGYSTQHIAKGCRYFDGRVYSIEVAQPKIDLAEEFFHATGLDSHIAVLPGWADEVLAQTKWPEGVDFAFFDADKENNLLYLKQIEPQLNPGALIIADNAVDYGDHQRDFLDYVTTDPHYDGEIVNMDNGLLIAVMLTKPPVSSPVTRLSDRAQRRIARGIGQSLNPPTP